MAETDGYVLRAYDTEANARVGGATGRLDINSTANEGGSILNNVSQAAGYHFFTFQRYWYRIEANDKLLVIAKEQTKAEIQALKDQKGALASKLAVEVDNADIKAQIYALNTAIIETEKRATSLEKASGEQKNSLLAEQLANTKELKKIGIDEVARQ